MGLKASSLPLNGPLIKKLSHLNLTVLIGVLGIMPIIGVWRFNRSKDLLN